MIPHDMKYRLDPVTGHYDNIFNNVVHSLPSLFVKFVDDNIYLPVLNLFRSNIRFFKLI